MALRKNLVYNTLLSISNVLLPIVTFPYASRILKPSGMGAVAYVDGFVQFFILLSALGMPIYGVREVAKCRDKQEKINTLVSELIAIHLISTVICIVVFTLVIFLIPKLELSIDLCLIGIGILFLNVFPIEWYFQGMEEFDFIVKRTLAIRLFSIILLFLLVNTEKDLSKYYIINLIILLLNSLINIYAAQRKIKIIITDLNFKKHIKSLLYIVGSSIAISVYIIMDSIILGTLSTATAVGYYTACIKIAKIPITLTGALAAVLIPQLTKAYVNKDNEKVKKLVSKSFEYVFFLGTPIAIGLIILAPDILSLFGGNNYIPASITLQILAPLVILLGMSNIFGLQIMTPLGKEKKLFGIVILGMMFSICGNLLLIPYLDHVGAGIINITTEIIVTILTGYYSRKYFNYNIPWRILVFAGVSIAPFTIFNLFIKNYIQESTILMLLINITFAVITYYLIQFLIFKNQIAIEITNFLMGFWKRKTF